MNLSCWWFYCIVLPLFLVVADSQSTPFRMFLFCELPTVADVSRSVELGDDLHSSKASVLDLLHYGNFF